MEWIFSVSSAMLRFLPRFNGGGSDVPLVTARDGGELVDDDDLFGFVLDEAFAALLRVDNTVLRVGISSREVEFVTKRKK
jgi:hypothetical protein